MTGFSNELFVASPTGATLKIHVEKAAGMPRAAVHINHDLCEHAARYARFARFLATRGYNVYAHDHRGHGATTAPDAPPGTFARRDGAARVIGDLEAVHALIAGEYPGLPLIVFGQGLGGVMALNQILRNASSVRAMAIWNADISFGPAERLEKALLAYERFRLGSDMPSPMLRRLTLQRWTESIAARRTDFDWLTRDREEVGRYVADPRCGWAPSVGMWRDILDLTALAADDRGFANVQRDLHFHLVGGEDDPVTDGGKAVRDFDTRLRRLDFTNLKTTIYPGMRHEPLNELNRDTAMEDFARWADRLCAPG